MTSHKPPPAAEPDPQSDDEDDLDAEETWELLPPPPGPNDTIEAGARWVRAHAERGVLCPCCQRRYQIYNRALYIRPGLWLLELLLAWERTNDWVHTTSLPSRGGDYAKLAHWGLIEPCPQNDDPSKTSLGLWRPTPQATLLVRHGWRAISHVVLGPENTRLGFEGYFWRIEDVLGNYFDVRDILRIGRVPTFDKKLHSRHIVRFQPGWRTFSADANDIIMPESLLWAP